MLTKAYALTCDSCGKWSTHNPFSSSKGARQHARSQGWKRFVYGPSHSEDLCPKCAQRTSSAQ